VPSPYIDSDGLAWTSYDGVTGAPTPDFGIQYVNLIYASTDCTGEEWVIIPVSTMTQMDLSLTPFVVTNLTNTIPIRYATAPMDKVTALGALLPVPAFSTYTNGPTGPACTVASWGPPGTPSFVKVSDMTFRTQPPFRRHAPLHWELR
jgi:hypothetical protein